MKRLCFGTIMTILYQARNGSKVTNDVLCAALFKTFGADFSLCGSTSGHLKSGHDNVPSDLKTNAEKLDFETVDANFQAYVTHLVKDTKKECVIRAIKTVLIDDTVIPDYRIVGYIKGYEKDNLIKKPKISFSAYVSSVLFYAITEVNNNECFDAIKEIPKDFVYGFENSDIEVYFESSDAERIIPLDRSLMDPAFKRTFEKVSDLTVAVPNPSTVQIYSVDIMNSKFRFKNTKDFLLDNITNYVSSREKITKMDKLGRSTALGSRALLKYIQAFDASAESLLGETLLYVFLEQELKAPKIMSKIEIDDIGGPIKSKSDGVHLFTSDNRGVPFNQLVFGASNIVGSLQSAIDNAFSKIIAIDNNYEGEFQLIDNTENYNIFSPEVNNYIKSVLIPIKNKTTERDMAFGCFLGYSLKTPYEEKNNEKYRILAKQTMTSDIKSAEPYIQKLISDNNLEGYSFYFYILPFNDAPGERVSLVEEMIGRS